MATIYAYLTKESSISASTFDANLAQDAEDFNAKSWNSSLVYQV